MAKPKLSGDHLQEKLQRWLSPPDPWTNYNIAHDIRHRDTSMWFTQGDVMKTWKSTGSLLWVNGLRACLCFSSLLIADGFQRLSRFREDDNFVCVMTTILYWKHSYHRQLKHY
jgi:hypothetical protein